MSIADLAEVVRKVVLSEFPDKGNVDIVTTTSDDIRSYHINSEKIKLELNFSPRYCVEDAVRDLCVAFKEGNIQNSFEDDIFYNIKTMKKIQSSYV